MPLPHRSRTGATSRRRACSVLAVGALGVGVLAALPSAAADAATARVAYPGSVPSLVHTAPDLGANSATDVEGEIFLNLKDTPGAQAFATAVSTPGNAQYGKFLSPAQWIATYAPSQGAFDSVAQYLRASGATIIGKPASREYIVFTTPKASTTQALFGTTLHNYRFQGKTVSAPSSAASLPSSIAKYVLGVNLGNARASFTHPDSVPLGEGTTAEKAVRPSASAKTAPKAVTGGNFSCSDYYGEIVKYAPKAYGRTQFPTNICGYNPAQLRSAGGLDKQITSGVDGTGQTVGIVDAYDSPSMLSDANQYFAAQGAPPLYTYKDVSFRADRFRDKGLCAEPSGWQTEQTLDVESAHSIAPGATILYSGGFDCSGGIDLAVSKILDQGLSDIVSNSYGDGPEPTVPVDYVRGANQYFVQAAGEGIGMYFSSGDNGDDSVEVGYPAAEFSASSPFVTAVGGTSEAIGADGKYDFETGWGDILDQFTLQDGHLKYTARSPAASTAAVAVAASARCSPSPTTRRASSRTRWPRRPTAGRPASSRTSRTSPTRTPGSGSGSARSSTRAPSRPVTSSTRPTAAPAWRRRSPQPRWRWSRQRRVCTSGSPTPRSTARPRRRRVRSTTCSTRSRRVRSTTTRPTRGTTS